MNYEHDTDEANLNPYDGLASLAKASPRLSESATAEDDALGMLWHLEQAMNTRFSIDTESWAPRCA